MYAVLFTIHEHSIDNNCLRLLLNSFVFITNFKHDSLFPDFDNNDAFYRILNIKMCLPVYYVYSVTKIKMEIKGTETFANYDSTYVNISPIKSEFEISGLISNISDPMVFYRPQGGLHPEGSRHPGVGGLHPRGSALGGSALGGPHPEWGLGRLPLSDTTVYGQRAGGTHPTGMHPCFLILSGMKFCNEIVKTQ